MFRLFMNALMSISVSVVLLFFVGFNVGLKTSADYSLQSVSRSIRFTGLPSSYVSFNLINNPSLNVGQGEFTIEWWMKPVSVNTTYPCTTGLDVFTNGHLIIDRDVFGPGDYGDFGVSIMGDKRLAFSVSKGSSGVTVCSAPLDLNKWYYVAAVRRNDKIEIYVNGVKSGHTPFGSGNVSYRIGRSTSYSADPYLVLGAEKHTSVGNESFSAYHYNGFLDDLRISNIARSIVPRSVPFNIDGHTVALFTFDNNNSNSSFGGFSGAPSGVTYSEDVPFAHSSTTPTTSPTPNPTTQPTTTPTAQLTTTPTTQPTTTPTATPTTRITVKPTVPPTQKPTTNPTTDTTVSPSDSPIPTTSVTEIPAASDATDTKRFTEETTGTPSSPNNELVEKEGTYSSSTKNGKRGNNLNDLLIILATVLGTIIGVGVAAFALYKIFVLLKKKKLSS